MLLPDQWLFAVHDVHDVTRTCSFCRVVRHPRCSTRCRALWHTKRDKMINCRAMLIDCLRSHSKPYVFLVGLLLGWFCVVWPKHKPTQLGFFFIYLLIQKFLFVWLWMGPQSQIQSILQLKKIVVLFLSVITSTSLKVTGKSISESSFHVIPKWHQFLTFPFALQCSHTGITQI